MADYKAPTALKLIDGEYKAGSHIDNLPKKVNELYWANLQPNTDGSYAFKEDTFLLDMPLVVPTITPSGNKYLVGVLNNWDKIADFGYKTAQGKNDKGKDNWVADETKTKEVIDKWVESGKLVAILVNDIPQLSQLVEVANGKLLMLDGYHVYLKTNPNKSLLEQIYQEHVEALPDEHNPKRMGNKLHKQFLEENSWFYLVGAKENVEEYCAEYLGGHVDVQITYQDDLLETIAITSWKEPEIKEKKKSGGSWGSSGGQAEKDILAERQAYVLGALGIESLDKVSEMLPKCDPILVNFVMSIATSSWVPLSNEVYNYIPASTNQPTITAAQNGNGSKPKVTDNSAVPDVTQSNNSADWVGLILKFKQDKPAIPEEVNEEFLQEKGLDWAHNYFLVIKGNYFTKTGKSVEAFSRGATASIKAKYNCYLHEMTINQLTQVLTSSEFQPHPDYVPVL